MLPQMECSLIGEAQLPSLGLILLVHNRILDSRVQFLVQKV